MEKTPLITVITVAYNEIGGIERTIQSVLGQSYEPIEYIIMDGGSTDGTVDVIREYEDRLAFWSSKPDKGIYDGMNQGVKQASGEWVIFMNAGDWFKSGQVLADVIRKAPASADMIYGDHEVIHDQLVKSKKARPYSELWKGMAFSHQSLLAKRELLVDHPFDLNEKIIADYHFIFHRWREGATFFQVGLTIACFKSGGVSEIKSIEAKKKVWQLARRHCPGWQTDKFHLQLIGYEYAVIALKKLLPMAFFYRLMKLKNKR